MQNDKLEIIILAAGKGTRMGGENPKVLTSINGRPMLSYLLDAVGDVHRQLSTNAKPLIVVGFQAEKVKEAMGEHHRYAHQTVQLGTGHAVKEALASIPSDAKNIIILNGDHPLVNSDTIHSLYRAHVSQSQPITICTICVPDFLDWRMTFNDFGRIIRNENGDILKIVEKNDASDPEKTVREVNAAYYCFDAAWLRDRIHQVTATKPKGEYYLTDLIGIAQREGAVLNSIEIPAHHGLGVNSPEQVKIVERFLLNE